MVFSDEESFTLLGIHVLKEAAKPTVAIASAMPQDGRRYVAFGLAKALTARGLSTIIIDCTSEDTETLAKLQVFSLTPSLQCVKLHDYVLSDGRTVRSSLRELNAHFDATVVVLGDRFAGNASLDVFMESTSTVVAVAMGRKAQKADYELRNYMATIDKPILGVVPTIRQASSFAMPALSDGTQIPVIVHEMHAQPLPARTTA